MGSSRQGKFGQTALFEAALAGQLEAVRFLLGHKADPRILSNDGAGPSFLACYTHGHSSGKINGRSSAESCPGVPVRGFMLLPRARREETSCQSKTGCLSSLPAFCSRVLELRKFMACSMASRGEPVNQP
jgi:Ankyrin repeat